jgi:hypothetical protein
MDAKLLDSDEVLSIFNTAWDIEGVCLWFSS